VFLGYFDCEVVDVGVVVYEGDVYDLVVVFGEYIMFDSGLFDLERIDDGVGE